jgi:hypothetical protein
VVTLETTQTPIERAVFFADYSGQPGIATNKKIYFRGFKSIK